jgi:hypothetical protein
MRWARHVAKFGGEERCLRSFGRETEGKVLLWKSRRRWEGNIKMAVNRLGGRGLQSSGSIWAQVKGFCEHENELSRYIKCGEFVIS